jgi:hypothetical protein
MDEVQYTLEHILEKQGVPIVVIDGDLDVAETKKRLQQLGKVPDSDRGNYWVRQTPDGICMVVHGSCHEEGGNKCVFGPASFLECNMWVNDNCYAMLR